MAALDLLPAAVVVDGVLQHVGNPIAEQRSLAAGRAVVPRGDRVVLAVSGEDRLTWLDSLTSQALARLAPGVATEFLVLDPQGRVEHAAGIVDDGDTAWLLVDAPDADGLLAWLLKMRFRLRVDPRRVDDVVVLGGRGEAVAAVAGEAIAPVWNDPWPGVTDGGWGYAPAAGHPGADWDWAEAVLPAGALDRLVEHGADGPALVGVVAADALRIAAARPRIVDVDDRALPHENDWLRTAVHLAKGCYRGQETVAKVHNLGHPPRRIVLLSLDGSLGALPAAGDDVLLDDVVVGRVSAVANHFEDGPIALAAVRRTVPVDAELVVAGEAGPVAAGQEVVVPPEAGATAPVPRLPRLGRRTT